MLLVTEEDYEQTDCTQAGSFQTWWVKRLDGTQDRDRAAGQGGARPTSATTRSRRARSAPRTGSTTAPAGIVAAGFYGGGTQFLDVRNPRDIKSYGHAVWGASEVWDAMWVPVYDSDGRQTGRTTNVVYSIDLVRGLDVYAVDVPGDGIGATPTPAVVRGSASLADRCSGGCCPLGLIGAALALAIAVRRRARRAGG